jgi:hypothetical protein
LGAPLGNRNAAGSRGGATSRMRKASAKAKSKKTLKRLGGKVRLTKFQRRMRYLNTGQK